MSKIDWIKFDLAKLNQKDQAEFEKIYHATVGWVYQYFASRLPGRIADAEDLTQEVFQALWNNVEPIESLENWLMSVRHAKWVDFLRKKTRQQELSNAQWDRNDSSEQEAEDDERTSSRLDTRTWQDCPQGPLNSLTWAALKKDLESALARLHLNLKEKDWRMLDLFLEDYTDSEIARKLQKSPAYVKYRKEQAIFPILRRIYEGCGG